MQWYMGHSTWETVRPPRQVLSRTSMQRIAEACPRMSLPRPPAGYGAAHTGMPLVRGGLSKIGRG